MFINKTINTCDTFYKTIYTYINNTAHAHSTISHEIQLCGSFILAVRNSYNLLYYLEDHKIHT